MAVAGFSFGGVSCRRAKAPSPAETEALARLLEASSQAEVLDRVVGRISKGLTPQALLSGLYAAAVRNVLTGKQFSKEQHILLCTHSVHLASQRAAASLRWHPLLWAVDYFKWAQAAAKELEPEPMPDFLASRLLSAKSAEAELQRAMETFDGPRAEAAVVSLHRGGDNAALAQLLFRYGSKDFRHIGHKAIHVAHGLATLDTIGWVGAENVLRSIALTLSLHYTEGDHDLDGAWVRNQGLVSKIGSGGPIAQDTAVIELLEVFRRSTVPEACDQVVEWLNHGATAQSVWDAMYLSSAELMFNHPKSIEALHAVTASSAAFAAFSAAKEPSDRHLLLLQNAARVVDFRHYTEQWAVRRQRPAESQLRIDRLEPLPLQSNRAAALEEIFADVGGDAAAKLWAAQKTLALVSTGAAGAQLLGSKAIERVVETAVNDSHDFKLVIAALDGFGQLSPNWRGRYLAACTARFRGAAQQPSELAARINEAAQRISSNS